MAESALHRSGKVARAAARGGGQVPRAAQVPAAAHHLGRRGDVLLFQGEIALGPARMVRPQSVPVAAREARTGRSHRTDHDAGLQLVQEPPPEGQGRRAQRQVTIYIFLPALISVSVLFRLLLLLTFYYINLKLFLRYHSITYDRFYKVHFS